MAIPSDPPATPVAPSSGAALRTVTTFDVADEALWRRWRTLSETGFATPFQTVAFARPLLTRLAPAMGARPFVVEVHDDAGRHLLSLGLCLWPGLVGRIEFPDFGLTDLCAPVWSADLDLAGDAGEALRRAVLAALPRHDALLLTKMPLEVAGRRNPLADWPGTVAMNIVTMVYDPASRPVGELSAVKESGRKRRKLARDGGAIRRIADGARADALLDFAFALRDAKARRVGRRESLERASVRDFYRAVVAEGLDSGEVRIWEVVLGERIVAMVLGLVHAGRFNGTLMATLDDDGLHVYSPGMIAVAAVIEDHVATGGRLFDLGPGEHPYKTRFGGEPAPLVEVGRAATPFGLLPLADHRLRRAARAVLRRHPALRARLYRLLGRA